MIVHDFDIFRASSRPAEAYPKLVVHANAVLPGPISPELFKTVAGRNAEVFKPLCDL